MGDCQYPRMNTPWVPHSPQLSSSSHQGQKSGAGVHALCAGSKEEQGALRGLQGLLELESHGLLYGTPRPVCH